jgi:enediyne biosynthesis protein E4
MAKNSIGKFDLKKLPVEAQFSPINGTLVLDINSDGNLDLLAIGNDYATEVLIGRYDAYSGNYLQGDGKGYFKNMQAKQSNFLVKGNAKSLCFLRMGNKEKVILALQNRDKLLAFKVNYKFEDKTSKNLKTEIYLGSGYLSQSSK